MELCLNNMDDCINNIPKGANIEVLYYGVGICLSYGKFVECNDKEIKIENSSKIIKTIDKFSISKITILDKVRLVVDN